MECNQISCATFTGAGYLHLCTCLAFFDNVVSSKSIAALQRIFSPYYLPHTLTYNAVVINAVACKGQLKDLSYPIFSCAGHKKSQTNFCLAVLYCSGKENYAQKPLEFCFLGGLETCYTMPHFSLKIVLGQTPRLN